MTLLINGKPKKFNDENEIFEEFYTFRLCWYIKRKKYLIGKLREEIKIIEERLKFIKLVNNKTLKILNKDEEKLVEDMIKHGLDPELRKNVKIHEFTQQQVERLFKRKVEKEDFLKIVIETEPEKVWETEILELKNWYIKTYGDDKNKKRDNSIFSRTSATASRKTKSKNKK